MLSQAACPSCGAPNRIGKRGRALSGARCGACAAPLRLAEPIDVDDAALDKHLRRTVGPVVLDVWAPWCGPCRMMAPNFEAAAADLAGEARLLKVNADNSKTAAQLNIRGIPTLVCFTGGREVARQAGLMSRDGILAWVRARAAAPTVAQS